MDFNHYFNNEELETTLKNWTKEYARLARLDEIGKSHEGRPVWLLTLTNFLTGRDQEKPAVWLDGNIHATELAGTTTTLFFIQHLLKQYGQDERITRLLDSSTFYIVPRINPDGAAAALSKDPRFLRSGVRAYPWEEPEDGLHVRDIDGDSRILQMRIPDPNGDWKPWPDDERLMVKREPADFGGTYYRLLPEGIIENYDGYVIDLARPTAGLDFNRNFPFEWRPENEQLGAGPFPTSEPEIGAVVRFISQHPNINVALSFHTFSRVLLRPFSTRSDEQMEPNDLYVYKLLGDMGSKITGYRSASTFHEFINGPRDITTGAFDDWLYDHFGAFVFTVELWDLPTEAGISERSFTQWFNRHPVEEDVQIYNWALEHAGPESYLPWRPFDHPQLGQVEIGGWDQLFTWRNPPPAYMASEAAKQLPFILDMSSLLPHLSLHTLEIRQVSERAWTIDLVVENTGYLPSYTSQQARKRQTVRPVMAELKALEGASEGIKVVVGKERMELGHLEGRSNKDEAASVYGRSATDNRKHIQWMVEAPAGAVLEIYIKSERAGQIRQRVTLEAQPQPAASA